MSCHQRRRDKTNHSKNKQAKQGNKQTGKHTNEQAKTPNNFDVRRAL